MSSVERLNAVSLYPDAAIAGQRAHNKSWAMIARGTGTSREGAYQRWGKGEKP